MTPAAPIKCGRPPHEPAKVCAPCTVEEVAADVAVCGETGLAVVPLGSGTRQGWLPGPEHPFVMLDLTGIRGLQELNQENLTARFGAGTPLHEVRSTLAGFGLHFPVGSADGEDVSLGGLLAAGAPDPYRGSMGGARDWVLGLEAVTAGGQPFAFGRPLMKNVAGYNMTRLLLGSRGTLGVIVGAVLRLIPLPEERCWATARVDDPATLADLAVLLRRPSVAADVAELLLPAQASAWQLILQTSGPAGTARRRLTAAASAMPGLTEAGPELWEARTQMHSNYVAAAGSDWIRLRASIPVGSTPAFLSAVGPVLRRWQGAAAGHLLSGGYTLWLDPGEGGLPQITQEVASLRREVQDLGGLIWAEAAPLEPARAFAPRSGLSQAELEAKVRTVMNPQGIFNPHCIW